MASHLSSLRPLVWGLKLQLGGSEGRRQGGERSLCRQTFGQPCVEHDAARCGQTCICNRNARGFLQCDGCIVYHVGICEHFDAIVALGQLVRLVAVLLHNAAFWLSKGQWHEHRAVQSQRGICLVLDTCCQHMSLKSSRLMLPD